MLTLKNKLTLLFGLGLLVTLFAVGTLSNTAKAAGEHMPGSPVVLLVRLVAIILDLQQLHSTHNLINGY